MTDLPIEPVTLSSLQYNVRWMEQTFTSKVITENLLNPERESGNITTNDFDRAIRFLPGNHRHYRLVGGLTALPLVFAFRRMRWSNTRMYLFVSASTLAGFLAGQTLSLAAHFRFVRSIENPTGFSQAMTNIQKTLGGEVPQSPIIVRQGEKVTANHDIILVDDVHPQSTPSTSAAPSSAPISKWDQIRALKSSTAGNSSWDTLRQNHERARVNTNNHGESIDRAMEQAQFDEMLEKERSIRE